jgi:hypothetical protein
MPRRTGHSDQIQHEAAIIFIGLSSAGGAKRLGSSLAGGSNAVAVTAQRRI